MEDEGGAAELDAGASFDDDEDDDEGLTLDEDDDEDEEDDEEDDEEELDVVLTSCDVLDDDLALGVNIPRRATLAAALVFTPIPALIESIRFIELVLTTGGAALLGTPATLPPDQAATVSSPIR